MAGAIGAMMYGHTESILLGNHLHPIKSRAWTKMMVGNKGRQALHATKDRGSLF